MASYLHAERVIRWHERTGLMTNKYEERLRVRDAADYIGLSISTLAKWRITGFGPRYIKAGARVLYDRADLDEWLKARRRSNTAQAHTLS
jgi:predicted DNA-binding transcriptional regulator AlpA